MWFKKKKLETIEDTLKNLGSAQTIKEIVIVLKKLVLLLEEDIRLQQSAYNNLQGMVNNQVYLSNRMTDLHNTCVAILNAVNKRN